MLDLYRKLFLILGHQRQKRFVGVVLVSLFSAALQMIAVGSVFPLIALLANPQAIRENQWVAAVYQYGEFESYESFLLFAGITMVVAIFLSNAANVLTIWLTHRFIADEHVRLSDVLLQKYAYKPYEFFLQTDSTKLSRDVLAEVGMFLGKFVQPLLDLLVRSVAILAVGGGLVLINPLAAIGAVLIFGVGYFFVYLFCRKKLEELGQIRIDSEVLKFKITWELFQGQREARLMNCREGFFDAYSRNSKEQQDAILEAALISLLPRQGIEVLGFALVFVLILLFRWQGMPWQDILPMLSLYAVGAIRMMPQFQGLFASAVALRTSVPVVERLVPEFTSSIDTQRREAPPLEWSDSIEFRDLVYSYPGTDGRVLDGLTCTVKKGNQIGFVGSTGAGKTTLIHIILGLLEPSEGELLVDGAPLAGDKLIAWQASLGFVPQDIFLCNDTIAANIAFGVPKEQVCMELVKKSAEMAALDEHVQSLPEGYQSLVGERGVKLSGGQRQRLGIARALYRDPSVLVLDEATSSLDGHTEDNVMEAIGRVGDEKTVFIIAHRLSTLKDCDVIFMLEGGRIVDSGTYVELLKDNETFRRFAKVTD